MNSVALGSRVLETVWKLKLTPWMYCCTNEGIRGPAPIRVKTPMKYDYLIVLYEYYFQQKSEISEKSTWTTYFWRIWTKIHSSSWKKGAFEWLYCRILPTPDSHSTSLKTIFNVSTPPWRKSDCGWNVNALLTSQPSFASSCWSVFSGWGISQTWPIFRHWSPLIFAMPYS